MLGSPSPWARQATAPAARPDTTTQVHAGSCARATARRTIPSESPAPDARVTLPTPLAGLRARRPNAQTTQQIAIKVAMPESRHPSIPAQRRPPEQCRRLPPQVRTCWDLRCFSLEAAAWRQPHQGSPLPAYPAPCGSRFQPLTLLSLDTLRPPPASFQSEEASGPPPPAPIAHQGKWYRPPSPLLARARPEGGQPQAAGPGAPSRAAGTQQMAAGPKNPISWPEGPTWERALPATWPTTDQAATAGPQMTACTIREQPSAHLRTQASVLIPTSSYFAAAFVCHYPICNSSRQPQAALLRYAARPRSKRGLSRSGVAFLAAMHRVETLCR